MNKIKRKNDVLLPDISKLEKSLKQQKTRMLPKEKDSLSLIKNTYHKQMLPFVFAHLPNKKKPEKPLIVLAKEAIPDRLEWMYLTEGDAAKPFHGISLDEVNFFITMPQSKNSEFLISAKDLILTNQNQDITLDSLLFLEPENNHFRWGAIADIAALFHSGVVVKKNTKYAHELIRTMPQREMLNELSNGLVVNCLDNSNIALTKSFLDLGANPNWESEGMSLALPVAIHNGNHEAAKLLIEYGASVTFDRGSLGSAWELLQEGDDIDKENEIYEIAKRKRDIELLDPEHFKKITNQFDPID